MARNPLLLCVVTVLSASVVLRAQFAPPPRGVDPGVRGGDPGAGGPLTGLNSYQMTYFALGHEDFVAAETVEEGLGPRMNLDSCGGCHSQPATGGSSPATNPQVAFATAAGALDRLPSFITLNGPVREARFVRQPDGSADGGVHALFTVSGRPGAEGCSIVQPDFEAAIADRNVVFRIPTPVFGLGLVEQIPDRRDPREPGEPGGRQARAWHRRQGEHQRERRDGDAIRLEGAEQVARDLLRRGLQRRDGYLE